MAQSAAGKAAARQPAAKGQQKTAHAAQMQK
jgi:hypothetical protein